MKYILIVLLMFIYTQKQTELMDLIENHQHILADGGSRCFIGTQLVITDKGNKCIKELKKTDKVLSYNEKINKEEFKKISKKHVFDNNKKDMIKIELKNGGIIIGTYDHVVNIDGKWLKLSEIKDLYYGNI